VIAMPTNPSHTHVSVKFQAGLAATIQMPKTRTAIAEGVMMRFPRSPMSFAVLAK
jgi:hypothetical protein